MNKIVDVILAVAAVTVLTAATAPIGLPFVAAVMGGDTYDITLVLDILTSKHVPEAFLAFLQSQFSSLEQVRFILVWALIVAAGCGLYLIYVHYTKPEREVDDGILGNAELVKTKHERKKRNVCWDGKGKAPGASLVYGYEGGSMIGDPAFAHGWVDAKSGCGKTRFIGYLSLFWNVMAGATVIYTARKLTEYKLTHKAIENLRFKTLLVDLERPKRGARFNLMDAVNKAVSQCDIASAQRAARQLAADFIKHDEKNPFFSNAARALMTATILAVAMADVEPAAKNLASVARVIREGLTGDGRDPAAPLKDYIRSLGAGHPAYKAAADFLQDNGTTAGRNVASTLMTGITVLGDEGIEWMLSGSDFALDELAEERCVVYPHCLGEDDPYNVVLAAFYNQLWTQLQHVASKHGDKLPHPFVILGDEWGNLPRVSCLGEMASLGRSMDLHVFVFVQNMAQLNKYNSPGDNGAGVDKLLGSMNLQIAMSVMKTDPDGKYFTNLCGKRTVRTRTAGTQKHGANMGPSGSSESMSEHVVDVVPEYTWKDKVPLRDGIVVVKGGENSSPGREGVFNMPVEDASRIKPVAEFFELGTKAEDQQRSMEEERILSLREANASSFVPIWCPDFAAFKSEGTRSNDIEDDEWSAWGVGV